MQCNATPRNAMQCKYMMGRLVTNKSEAMEAIATYELGDDASSELAVKVL